MSGKILLVVLGVGIAVFATQACAEDGSEIPLERRGMIVGTMAHLKIVKLREVPPVPAYIVNHDNVQRADDETARFIAGLSRSCLQVFWGE